MTNADRKRALHLAKLVKDGYSDTKEQKELATLMLALIGETTPEKPTLAGGELLMHIVTNDKGEKSYVFACCQEHAERAAAEASDLDDSGTWKLNGDTDFAEPEHGDECAICGNDYAN